MADRTGEQWGNYRLIQLLGRGGFAEVYLGEHVRLGMRVAIKILHGHLTENEITLFQIEAKTVVDLKHPHIVRILDFDVHEGRPFLVMDYAQNGSLRLKNPYGTQIPPAQVIAYTTQVASALQYAHDRKLIHRDVKPENMLIDEKGKVMLSDFGIATIAHTTSSMNTQASLGTPVYMSPEQIQGKPRLASDQYALGIVVYQWLSGFPPFSGSSTEIIAQHLATVPPLLREKVPGLSIEAEQVVQIALAKDPKDRFANIQAFATALSHALGGKYASIFPLPHPQAQESTTRELTPVALTPIGTPSQSQSVPAPPVLQLSSLTSIGTIPPAFPTTPKPVSRLQVSRTVWMSVTIAALAMILVLSGIVGVVLSQNYQKRLALSATATTKANYTIATARTEAGYTTATATTEAGYTTATATTEAGYANATATTTKEHPYPHYIQGSGTLVFTDPLTDNTRGNSWTEGSQYSCSFEGAAYHAIETTGNALIDCEERHFYSNFTIEVEMTIVKGDCGGIMFGWKTSMDYYSFTVCQDGSYLLYYVSDKTKGTGNQLAGGFSPIIREGANQLNTLAIVVNRGHYILYVNQQQIDSGTDGGSGTSNIGLISESYGTTTDVAYKNISIWT